MRNIRRYTVYKYKVAGLLPETPMTIVDNEQQMITFPSFDVQHAGS